MSVERHYPKHASILLASHDDAERYYVKTPVNSLMTIPALDAEQARQLAADKYRGFGPEDFEIVESRDDVDFEPYPDPVDGRPVNEHDLWMLRAGNHTSKWSRQSRRPPTERMIQAVLDEWDDPQDIPLDDPVALQQAHGIGPTSAARLVGAAVSNRLLERPVRGDSDV